MFLSPGRGKDVLVQLINENNVFPHPLANDDVFMSTPIGVASTHPTEVQVKVVGLPYSMYEGVHPFNYRRIDLSSAFGDVRPLVEGTSNGTLSSILPAINMALGTEFLGEDIEEVDYSWLQENETVNIPVRARATSLLYTGQFTVQFTRRRYQLADKVGLNTLPTLLIPGASSLTSVKRPVNTVIYSTDFTEHYEKIKRHKIYNIFNNGTSVQLLMNQLFGFVSWPTGWVNPCYDHPTSAVAAANQEYDRVIVQNINAQAAASRNYEGTAYFHYNLT